MGLNRIRRAGAEKASGPFAFSGVVESEAGAIASEARHERKTQRLLPRIRARCSQLS